MSKRLYTLGEELFNSITHGVGTLLAIAAFVIMIVYSALLGDGYCLASALIYGITLIVLYLSSTLYHAITNEKAKYVFRVLDHSSIFLLIAGTYTPFTLISLKGSLGWVIFSAIWCIAILGIVLNCIDFKKFAKISLILYILMGWAIVFAMKSLLKTMPPIGVLFLLLGGITYTLGIIFYVLKKVKYMHSIWHLFVLGGSVLHFFSIFLYVFPVFR